MNEPRITTRPVKIIFDDAEKIRLGADLSRAIGNQRNIESDFDDIKASFKAKIASNEAEVDRLSTALTVGFEMRPARVWVTYRPKDRKKEFRLEGKGPEVDPVLIEDMNEDDYALELIQAEEAYVDKIITEVAPRADGVNGVEFISARIDKKWVCAIRGSLGAKRTITERLDSEQPAFKTRLASVAAATKRYKDWLGGILKNEEILLLMKWHDGAIDGLRDLILKQDAAK